MACTALKGGDMMQDVEIIGMLKTYVSKTLVGMGALKGAPCTIKSITKSGDLNTVVFEWTDTDSVKHESTMLVYDGADGNDGFSPTIVVKTSTSSEYVLTITDKNGSYDTPNLKGSGGGSASALSDLTDVSLTSLANGDVLVYDSTAGKWENVALDINNIAGIDLAGITDGQILVYDADNDKFVPADQTGTTYTAGAGIDISAENEISSEIVMFTGTLAQWNTLSTAEKKGYTHACITDDTETGIVDLTPTENSTHLVTSGGVYSALAGKANTADLGTAAAKDSTNAVTENDTDLVESGAVYSAIAGAVADLDVSDSAVAGSYVTAVSETDGKISVTREAADATPTSASNKMVKSGGVYEADMNEAVTRSILGAHNLLNIFNSEINVSGTYTEVVNSDGTVTIGGTPTSACTIPYKATALYNGSVYNFEPSTNYVLASGLSDISPLYIQVFTKDNSSASWTKIAETTTNTSLSFTTPSSFYDVWARILIPANAVVPANTVVKPQIRLATDAYSEYTPYVPTNAELLSYKDNGVLGAKNLLNIDSGTVSSCSLANNGFTNTDTDARDFFNFAVKALNSSSTLIDQMAKQAITDAGEYSFDVTIPDNTAYILIQHVGSTRNIQISVPSSLKAGNYIFSFKVQSANPTTVGGLDIRNIMIRLATDTDTTYTQYAMTNRELTEAKTMSASANTAIVDVVNGAFIRCGKHAILRGYFHVNVAAARYDTLFTLGERTAATNAQNFYLLALDNMNNSYMLKVNANVISVEATNGMPIGNYAIIGSLIMA